MSNRPNTNSRGLAVHPWGVARFWDWFTTSRTVDNMHRPLMLFHGTGGSIDRFDESDKMCWASEDPAVAGHYADLREELGGDHFVMPVYMRALAPLDADLMKETLMLRDFFSAAAFQAVRAQRDVDHDALADALVRLDAQRQEEESGPYYNRWDFWNEPELRFGAEGAFLIRHALQDLLGFDSIRMTEQGSLTWGVFSPHQVKSALGNDGLFDPHRADIVGGAPRPFDARGALAQAVATVYRDERLWQLLIEESAAHAGPDDGACLICAQAILEAAGRGELVRITSDRNAAEHYGVAVDGQILDFYGCYPTPAAWLAEFRRRAHIDITAPGRTWKFRMGAARHDQGGRPVPRDAATSRRIADMLLEAGGEHSSELEDEAPALPWPRG